MARDESNREDLLREATALVERAEIKVPGHDEPVVAGFRRDGSASFFFGADPVYQFNTAGELRRAFVGGLLYKAVKGGLVELRRERTAAETVLVSRELSAGETESLLAAMQSHLLRLREALSRGDETVLRQIPGEGDLSRRICEWLGRLPPAIRIASAPNVR